MALDIFQDIAGSAIIATAGTQRVGESNVFEVVRSQFVDMDLPVDGALYQGVVMYAVKHY